MCDCQDADTEEYLRPSELTGLDWANEEDGSSLHTAVYQVSQQQHCGASPVYRQYL